MNPRIERGAHLDLAPRADVSFEFLCPRCQENTAYLVEDIPPKGCPISCANCGLDFAKRLLPQSADAPVRKCWLCGGREFHLQKDFNATLGAAVVLVSMCVITLMMLLIDPLLGLLCFLLVAAAFVAIYRFVSTCVVCYRCHGIYRGFPASPELSSRFHAHAVKYETEHEEWVRSVLSRTSRPAQGASPTGHGPSPTNNPATTGDS